MADTASAQILRTFFRRVVPKLLSGGFFVDKTLLLGLRLALRGRVLAMLDFPLAFLHRLFGIEKRLL